MWVTPLNAAFGEHTAFGTPIAEAKAHATRLVIQQRIGLSLDLLVDFLPQRGALNGIEFQGAVALFPVVFIADVLDVNKTL